MPAPLANSRSPFVSKPHQSIILRLKSLPLEGALLGNRSFKVHVVADENKPRLWSVVATIFENRIVTTRYKLSPEYHFMDQARRASIDGFEFVTRPSIDVAEVVASLIRHDHAVIESSCPAPAAAAGR